MDVRGFGMDVGYNFGGLGGAFGLTFPSMQRLETLLFRVRRTFVLEAWALPNSIRESISFKLEFGDAS